MHHHARARHTPHGGLPMTTVSDALTVRQGRRISLLRRPKESTGFWSWFTTVDHKKIALLYTGTALIFFVIGGIEALLIRLQLAQANGNVLTAAQYNQLFTMHGTTMVFLLGMPLAVAFGNYLIPLMIGARDVAFPRVNMFGYWAFLFGGIFLYSSFFLGGAPNGGWFGYTPLTSSPITSGILPGRGPDFWTVGLIMLGIGSTSAAINFIVTIINLRAPGMTLMRMPVFVWMMLVVAFLTLFAIPIITVALIMVFADRNFATNFFLPGKGGDPLLYQHLFWLFGHPEVYILILPGMGIVSEILPVFSRKPLFGYAVVVFSGIAIGFLGWGVWAHHMFATGLGPVAISAFGLSTMLIAIPTGVKIFNWLGTVWKGSVRLTTAMLFALGFIAQFTIGGLSGVLHSVVPADTQQTDTYFVVAHFHYVLFGGLVFGIFGGFYYWYPKVYGRYMNERLGKWNFWTMVVGLQPDLLPDAPARSLGPAPAHVPVRLGSRMGLVEHGRDGRRVHHRPLGAAVPRERHREPVPRRAGTRRRVGRPHARVVDPVAAARVQLRGDPRDRGTRRLLAPQVHRGRRGTAPAAAERRQRRGHRAGGPTHDSHGGHGIHMPSPSYFPLIMALGLPIIGYGAVFKTFWLLIPGAIVVLFGIYAWFIEPATATD